MDSDKINFLPSVELNTDTRFPYLVLDVVNDNSFPQNLGFQVMHWHDDLQLIYVLEGSLELKTLEDGIPLHKGEGIFINKKVIHMVQRSSLCHYNSFIFPDYFLGFYPGSPAQALVEDIVNQPQFPLYHFSKETQQGAEILFFLEKLSKLEKNKTDFYAYEVLVSLSSLWLLMRKNLSFTAETHHRMFQDRMRKFLQYIETHFMKPIRLDQLASSANVSKSECLRCFKQSLQTTPYKYLMEFRLSKAAAMLKNTDEPIKSIATAVGFNQISHFGECFKEKTGFSPRDYRRAQQIPNKKR